jgi:hypothetical protein
MDTPDIRRELESLRPLVETLIANSEHGLSVNGPLASTLKVLLDKLERLLLSL